MQYLWYFDIPFKHIKHVFIVKTQTDVKLVYKRLIIIGQLFHPLI